MGSGSVLLHADLSYFPACFLPLSLSNHGYKCIKTILVSFESTCEPRLCSSLQPQARKPILKISNMQLSSHQSAILPNRYIRFVTCMTSPNLVMPPLSPCPLLPLAQTFLCPLQSGRNEGSESVESHQPLCPNIKFRYYK